MIKRYILITGSSRGLGLQIAKKLESKDLSLILTGRDAKNLKSALDSLKYPKNHFILEIDFEKEISKLFEFIEEKNLMLEGIIHNLGVKLPNDSHPIDIELLHKTMDLNLYKSVEINSTFIKNRLKYKSKIIHIGSNIGYSGNASPSYSISKGALNTYVKNIARFYAKENIAICAILPGAMDHIGSDWAEKKLKDPQRYEEVKKSLPLGKFCDVDEVAAFVEKIYNLDAEVINGSLFKIDGGI